MLFSTTDSIVSATTIVEDFVRYLIHEADIVLITNVTPKVLGSF